MDKLLIFLAENNFVSQRDLAKNLDYSLGKINKLLKYCVQEDLLSDTYSLTQKGHNYIRQFKVDNAIILAAGFGSRFVPITYEKPKGLVEVNGEIMIERQIKHLLEKGINDITIVVGYKKECFDYLIDKYGVKLVYNKEYAIKNNLASLYCVKDLLKNTYILSSDNYITKNIYSKYEPFAWYSCVYSQDYTKEYCMVLDKKDRICGINIGDSESWYMYGSVYFSNEFSQKIRPLLEKYNNMPGWENKYWEDVYIQHISQLDMFAKKFDNDIVYEFENLEELRAYDKSYIDDSRNYVISIIKKILKVNDKDIVNIKPWKLGMTNNSFVFDVADKRYICRIPGEGSEKYINRQNEKNVYKKISDLGICENVLYFGDDGIKISEFIDNARPLDKKNKSDMLIWANLINKLHSSQIVFNNEFNCRKEIKKYLKLLGEHKNNYFVDIDAVIKNAYELCDILDNLNIPLLPCHIDAHYDNILLQNNKAFLFDWEYAGNCDEIADVSMCAIYSYYSQQQAVDLLELKLGKKCSNIELFRLYAYMSLGGLIWTLWVLFKQLSGENFGEYVLKMYRYAKEYYQKAKAVWSEKLNN